MYPALVTPERGEGVTANGRVKSLLTPEKGMVKKVKRVQSGVEDLYPFW